MVNAGFCSILLVASLVLDVAFAKPLVRRSPFAVKDSHNVPFKWKRVGTAPQYHTINLQIALTQSQFGELEKTLYEVSDPSHPSYGNHLTQAEVMDLVKPTEEALESVHAWLEDAGVDRSQLQYSPAKDWIKASLPVATVEKMLNCKYSVYRHEDGTHLVRTPEWSLPEHLHEHVQTIQPTNSFFRPRRQNRQVMEVWPMGQVPELKFPEFKVAAGGNPSLAAACNVTAVTPLCLRTLYGTIDYTPKAAGKNTVGMNNFLNEVSNRSDATIYLQKFRPDAVDGAKNFKTISVNGGRDFQGPENATFLQASTDVEGNLDAQTLLGIGHPTPMVTFNTGGQPPFMPDNMEPTNTNEPYMDWINFILAQSNIPQTISTSYGDDEQTVPQSYAQSVCNGLAQLGARGVTLLFASGDAGVGSGNASDCVTNDGKNKTTFLPAFPAGCPYVTTVGATMNITPEVAAFDRANGFVSGGGFSNYFARPKYQDSAVQPYVQSLGNANAGLFNKDGRGYPDIAAQGFRFTVVYNGQVTTVDGTSASTPAAAAVIALANDALIAAGKPPMGFINPWLYSGGSQAFTDVTSGSSLGCGTDGFPAKQGWDAVTGFGTPNFQKIQAAVLQGNATRNNTVTRSPLRRRFDPREH